MDLSEYLVPNRVTKLLDLIEQCPEACRWREAAANDAEYLAWEQQDKPKITKRGKWSPRVAEFDLHAYLLLQLVNLTGTIASDKRIKKFQQLNGPVTQHEQAEQIVSAEQTAMLFKALTPGG